MTDFIDTAQICLGGHIITDAINKNPEYKEKFCSKCGKATIVNCPNCNKEIKGHHYLSGVIMPRISLPKYCSNCGEAYPWTKSRIETAQKLTDDLKELNTEEKEELKKTIDNIVQETPQTENAATRFKWLTDKAGLAAKPIRELIVDIASETAKKIILSQTGK